MRFLCLASSGEGWAFVFVGDVVFVLDGLPELLDCSGQQAAAVIEPCGLVFACPHGVSVCRLVLVEGSGGDVPRTAGLGTVGPRSERFDDVGRLVDRCAAAAVASVVDEPLVDVVELGAHLWSAFVEFLGAGEFAVEVAEPVNQLGVLCSGAFDVAWVLFNNAFRLGDIGFVASPAQRSIMFCQHLACSAQFCFELLGLCVWFFALLKRSAVIAAEMFEVVVELVECRQQFESLVEQLPQFVTGQGPGSVAVFNVGCRWFWVGGYQRRLLVRDATVPAVSGPVPTCR